MVPLWWDAGTLEDLRAWKRDCGGEDNEQFIAPLHGDKPFSRHASEAISHSLSRSWPGTFGNAHDPSRASHFHFACARRRTDIGRGPRFWWACECFDYFRLSARGSRR
jgi:hypothetical protein